MATSEWAAGYLEALIESSAVVNPSLLQGAVASAGASGRGGREVVAAGANDGSSFNAADMKGQSSIALRYFVNEITGFSEEQLHRTWMKATVMKNVGDRGSRLENFCWRIWHLSRRKRQLKLEAASRLEQRRKEQREVESDLRQEMDELEPEGSRVWDEAAEGEDSRRPSREAPAPAPAPASVAGAAASPVSAPLGSGLASATAVADGVPAKEKCQQEGHRGLYIVMISMHGLVRGENMELGRDSDTGGQVKYVVEYARALATMPSVYRVDLLTRQIADPEVDFSYGEPLEMLGPCQAWGEEDSVLGESAGAYIVRVPCGPTTKYFCKEKLWPFIPEFVDNALAHVHRMSRVLMDEVGQDQPVWPHIIHGHYADAGDAAALLSGALNVPMVMTGHSLGRNKLEQLLKQGTMSMGEIVAQYSILRRIEGEELAIDAAELVVTSTRQEVDDQWGLYDGFDVRLERVLRLRQHKGLSCYGRYMPRMAVIPPGMDFTNVVVPSIGDEEAHPSAVAAAAAAPPGEASEPAVWSEIRRFFTNPSKPMILALARPDPKKNLTALVKAYGTTPHLRELANLTLIMGNRDDIDEMPRGNADVLMTVLKLIDKYDLYGLVAYPKHHKQSDVSHIYALAAKSKGVFVNPALVEPFGLTLIEAAARGLPMVATKNGGPVDIEKMLGNGILVDPHDEKEIAQALLELVSDRQRWMQCRKSALENIHRYSWPQHCATLLSRVAQCRLRQPKWHAKHLFDALSGAHADGQGQGQGEGQHFTMSDSISSIADLNLRLSMDGTLNNASPFGAWGAKGSLTGTTTEWYSLVNQKQPGGGIGQEALHSPAIGGGAEGGDESLGSNRAVSSSTYVFSTKPNGQPGSQTTFLSGTFRSSGGGSMRLQKRRRLVVIAVDDYNVAGQPAGGLTLALKSVLSQREQDLQQHQGQGQEAYHHSAIPGIAVASALSARELLSHLRYESVPLELIDVVIASGGSAVYYSVPCPSQDETAVAFTSASASASTSTSTSASASASASTSTSTSASASASTVGAPSSGEAGGVSTGLEDGRGWQLVPDPDYAAHIDYRWSADAVRRSMTRVLSPVHAKAERLLASTSHGSATDSETGTGRAPSASQTSANVSPSESLQALMEDGLHSSGRCLAYRVLQPEKMPSLHVLRKRLRLRGLRLHILYCRAASSLLVLPLHASRAQALRYLFVRWGIDVAKMTVLMAHSPANDSDAPQLLSGSHRTLLLEGITSASLPSKSRLGLLDSAGSLSSVGGLPNVHCLPANNSFAQVALQ